MKVLALCSYPTEAAATRYRLNQFRRPLAERGIELHVSPFMSSAVFEEFYKSKASLSIFAGIAQASARRFAEVASAKNYDLVLVQREAALIGPDIIEWLISKLSRVPMVLDLDDATYVRYVSPTHGKLGSYLKFFGKTDRLIDRSKKVICGNRFIAEYVENRGTSTVVIPTVVDTEIFCPRARNNTIPVIGWVGTHSTFPFVESILPVLSALAEKHRFILRLVGAGREKIFAPNVEIDNLKWSLTEEVGHFQSFDIGLYPMKVLKNADSAWLAGKSGFKAVQYMSVGIPFVMTPIGVTSEMGIHGTTHFNAASDAEWLEYLDKLLSQPDLTAQMGRAGRRYAVEHYALDLQAELLADTLKSVIR